MRKRFYLLLVATLAFMSANARQINEREAQLKAEKFFGKQGQNHSNMRRAPRKAPKLILASNREELYIFNDKANGGYIVISGDDRMPDVLAYSYDGVYNDDEIPCNMKAWMDDCAGQVAYLRSHPEAEVKRQTATERKNIDPLLTCWFNQDSPYNNKCPEVDGERCPTGCVATAMAQIMYYYQWPKRTTEFIPEYTTRTLGTSIPGQPITTIDWDNIRSEYWNDYSNEEADAISTLMVLCGTAVNMDYCLDGSGSSDFEAAKALRKFFDYDDLLGVVARGRNTDSWENMIYEELNCSRPVLYCGSKINVAGHAFVLDGYEDGYFHVNWGWGGAYSYVLMTDVGGYNEGQTAIVGIQPVNPDPAAPRQYAVLDNGKMTLYYDNKKYLRSGTVIPHKDDWCNRNDITECVIDPSFSNLRLRSLFCFFDGLSQLKSIDGIENLRTDNVMDMAGMFQLCSSLTSLDLSSFNTENVTNMHCMFWGCSSLTSLNLSGFKTDNVTDMGGMFTFCSSLTSLDLSSFNTANVMDMGGMFNICSGLASLDVSGFKTANVTDMSGMFQSCSSLTSLDLSGLNTENVTSMVYMFNDCSSLTSLDVRNFKTDNVTNMYRMFENCSSLTSLDLSSFNTDKVMGDSITGMARMFKNCSSLKKLDLSSFNTDNVASMSNMFYCCSSLTSLDLSGFKTDNVTNMREMFSGCSSLTSLDVSSFKTDNVTRMDWMFSGCSGLTSLDVSSFKTDNVTNMSYMFSGSSLTSLDLSGFNMDNVTNMECMFYRCSSLTSLDVNGLNTANVTNMREMFSGCSSLTSLDVSNFKTDNVTDMYCMFSGCSSLTSLDLSGFKTDNVTNMGGMFVSCKSLTSLDLSSFKTDNVTNMSSMLSLCSGLTNLDVSSFNTEKVRNMGGMFGSCSSLTSLDLSSFNTESVRDMGGMFGGCSSLTSLDLSSFNTESVRDMGGMFGGCINLKKIYVGSGWTSVNVTEGKDMFYLCLKLVGGAGTIYDGQHRDYTYAHIDGGAANPGYFRDKNLPDPPEPYAVLSNDNTVLTFYYDDQMETRGGMYVESRGVVVIYEREWESHSNDITTVVFDESFSRCETLTNTAYWFKGCSKLKNIVGIENLNTEHVTDMEYMFRGCSSLTSLDVSGFKTDNVTNMHDMFLSCSSLTSLAVSGFNTANVTDMRYMFDDCSRLTSLDVSGFMTDNVTRIDGMFSGCSSLTSLDVSGFNTANVTDMNGMFSGCSSLTSLDLSSFKTDNVTNMYGMFSGCSSLTSLDLSSFKTENVTDMGSMFYGCSCLKKIFVSAGWKINNVTSGDYMFSRCSQLMGSAGTIYDGNHKDYTYAHIDGGTDNPGYLSDKHSFCPYALLSEDNNVLSFYYDDQMESRGGMDVYYERQWLKYSDDIITVVFDKSFADCTTLTSMSVWFSGCSKLKSIVGLNNLRTDNVTDMNQMFGECSSLTSLDLSSFKTENVTDMGYMFYGCSGLTSLDLSSFKTANVTSMDNMFYGCRKLKRIYVGSEWTINNVTSGEYMFNGCSKLIGGAGTKYEWGLWDYTYAHIDGGTDNPGYFRDINIPYFEPYALLTKDNTILTFYYDDQMESRGGMDVYEQPWRSLSGDIITVVFDESFASCTSLTSTANWFEDCSNLKDIIGIENLRTGNVTDMYSMFYRCSSLTSLDLSSFNTANVTNMSWMFYNCENLKTIYVREGWNTSKVKNSNSMFGGCLKLEGGSGTTYNDSHITANYAHIDGGVANPGYLTYKDTYKTIIYMVDGEEYKSYRLEIGKDIIPEPKPTKDGYVFIGWDDIPSIMPDHDVVVTGAFYPYGDVNTDKDVDVLDVVDIARYVVEIPSESFVMQLADINKDGNVNLGDAVTLVNEIAGEQNFVRAKASPKDNYINDVLSLTEWNGSLSLNLQNERYYTAFQFDLYVPEGSDVTQMSLNTKRKQGHQLLYNKVKDGHYRVAALSTSNNEFIGKEGELMNIVMNGVSDDEVSVRDIHFFDVKGNDYLFEDIYGSTVTSVRQIDNGKLIMENSIYDLQGRKRLALQRGVNIVGGNKVIVK